MADETVTNEELDVEESEFITLEYEDGGSERCEVVGVFDVNEKDYIALVPDSDQDNVYLYGYDEHEDGTFSLIDIEDEEEFATVAETYDALLEEDDEDEDAE